MKLYDRLLDVLHRAGVRQIFGVPGDAINPLVEALRLQDRIRFIHVVHEEAGALAASAQAKLTGRLTACAGTVGPGAIHLLNGLYDAAKDHAPVLALVGQVPTDEIGFQYHQEVDLEVLFRDVARYGRRVASAGQIGRMAVEACHAALWERGVSVLVVPHDVGKQDVDDEPFQVALPGPASRLLPSEEALQRAVERIEQATRITILYGEGCRHATNVLLALAERLRAPMVHSLRALDLVAHDHPLVAGGLGLLGTRGGIGAVSGCDLLLVLGSDFPYRDWYPEDVPIVRVDLRGRVLGRRTERELGLVGDCRSVIEALIERLPPRTDEAHLRAVTQEREAGRRVLARRADPARSRDLIHPQALASLAGRLADHDAVFTCDTGAVTVWAARHLRLRQGQRFLLSFNLATMAFALPAALGAQLALPDRQVVALCGDGGFNMLMGDLLTAVKYELPIKVLLFDNGRLGLIQMEQEAEGYPEHETELQNPDYVLLARSFGVRGDRVSDPARLEAALAETLAAEGPALLDVRIASSELTLPPRIELRQAWGFTKAKLKEWLADDGEAES